MRTYDECMWCCCGPMAWRLRAAVQHKQQEWAAVCPFETGSSSHLLLVPAVAEHPHHGAYVVFIAQSSKHMTQTNMLLTPMRPHGMLTWVMSDEQDKASVCIHY